MARSTFYLMLAMCVLCCRYSAAMDIKDNLHILFSDICAGEEFNLPFQDIPVVGYNANVSLVNSTTARNSDNVTAVWNSDNVTEGFNLSEICSNPEGYLFSMPPDDNVFLKDLQYYLTGISGVIVCLLGCLGNGMSVAVLRNKMYASSTNMYLLTLAASDSLLLIFALLISFNDIFDATWPDSKAINNFQAYTFPFIQALVSIFQTISIWLVLAFTIDRYIMICHPFQGVKLCTRKRARIVVACLYIAGVLYNMPKFFEHRTEVLYKDGRKYVGVRLTAFGASQAYLKTVHLWTYLIFIFVLPCLTLAVLNYQLIVTVKQSKTEGRRLSLGMTGKHRNDTTVMLVAVVVMFLICQMPALISHVIWASDPHKVILGGERYNYLHIIREMANFLVVLNSAINILLYYVFSSKFRKAFLTKFCTPCLRKSKLLATAFTRCLSCRSAGTRSSTDTPRTHKRINRYPSGSSGGSTSKDLPNEGALVARPSTVSFTFSTTVSCDGTSLITPGAVDQFTQFITSAEADTCNKYGGTSNHKDSTPIHV